MEIQKLVLVILDGWGIGDGSKADAISSTETPYIDNLKKLYPNSILSTSGEAVGLPDGQMGNSEVGHMNIGAGRIIYQDLVKINKEIESNDISKNKVLIDAFNYAKNNNKAVHFIGLVSDGGVHSLDSHLYKLCDITKDYSLEKVYIHAITDGRDTDPQSGLTYVENLEKYLKNSNGEIATLIGRYYTMDRDERWERIKKGYDLMLSGIGKPVTNILSAIQESYDRGITDEFIEPIVKVDINGKPITTIQEDDVVICFNYRTDRLKEITSVLTQQDMPDQAMSKIKLYYLTMTCYDTRFKGIEVIYKNDSIVNTLGEVLSKHDLKQLRIAETEKFAHVTNFISGGKFEEFKGEKRILVPSPKVATYDLQPEMSAPEVTSRLIEELNSKEQDLIIVNFANGDMVGHTGVYDAIAKAIKTVDECVHQIVDSAKENKYEILIIADHGNADVAINPDGTPNTAHTTNPVPVIFVSERFQHINSGNLSNVAPTILKAMGIEIPEEMTGKPLI